MAVQKGRSPKVDPTAARIAAHGRPVVEITGWVSEVSDATVRVHESRDGRRSIDIPRDAIVEIVDGAGAQASRIFVSGEALLRLNSMESTMVPASIARGEAATWQLPTSGGGGARLGRPGLTMAKAPGSPVIPPDRYEVCLWQCDQIFKVCVNEGMGPPGREGEYCDVQRQMCIYQCSAFYGPYGPWGR